MGLAQEKLLQTEQEYSTFLRTHRFSKEGIYALSDYFCWCVLHEDLLEEITNKDIVDNYLSKCPEDVKNDFMALYKFRGKLIPVCNDDYGQQEYTYFKGEYISNGAYNFDRTDMLSRVSAMIDLELNAPLHREYEEDYDFWKSHLPAAINE